jgi:hypothetical protein
MAIRTNWLPNQLRVLLSGLAYTLMEAVRRLELAGTKLAWALIPNHAHLLLRTLRVPIAALMQRRPKGRSAGLNNV